MRAVQAPDGREWKVGRQWLPFRVRLRRQRDLPDPNWWLHLGDFVDFSLGGILVGLALAVLGVLLLFVVWPVVALAIEIVVLVIVFLVALAGRVFFRRPWRVVARTSDSFRASLAWHVAGWGESGRVIDEVADAIAAGHSQPRPAGAERVLLEQ